MKYNWAHDQLKGVAPANQKKKRVKKPSRILNKKKNYLKIKYSQDNISFKFSLEQSQKCYSSQKKWAPKYAHDSKITSNSVISFQGFIIIKMFFVLKGLVYYF